MTNTKALNEVREVFEDHIQKITRKGANMTPPDVDILNKLLCGLECLQRLENGTESYSRNAYPSRDSRSASNSTRYYDGNSGNSGYSGHSIHDRMIANLEHMMSEAQNDYERQQIRDFIQKAREF